MFVAMEKIGRLKSADDEWEKLNEVYRQKNKNDLAKHNVDRSNRGDTEYLPKAQGGGGGGKAPPKSGIRRGPK